MIQNHRLILRYLRTYRMWDCRAPISIVGFPINPWWLVHRLKPFLKQTHLVSQAGGTVKKPVIMCLPFCYLPNSWINISQAIEGPLTNIFSDYPHDTQRKVYVRQPISFSNKMWSQRCVRRWQGFILFFFEYFYV